MHPSLARTLTPDRMALESEAQRPRPLSPQAPGLPSPAAAGWAMRAPPAPWGAARARGSGRGAELGGWATATACHQWQQGHRHWVEACRCQTTQVQHLWIWPPKWAHGCNRILKQEASGAPFKEVWGLGYHILSTNHGSLFRHLTEHPHQAPSHRSNSRGVSTKAR